MSVIQTDIAIVGSGCSGAAAAAAAAELGLKVTVFEKAKEAGGPLKGANGPFAVGSAMQKERQYAFNPANALELLIQHTHGRIDARLAAEFFNKSADTIAWLQQKGAIFSDVVAYYQGAEHTWHFKEREAPNLTDILLNDARKNGAEIYLNTKVLKLQKKNGRITGLIAATQAGEKITVKAKAVVLATGGFGGNPEMIARFTGYHFGKNLFSFAFPDVQGEGIDMAWKAGAGASPMMMQTYVCLPAPYWGPGGTPPDLGSFRQPNLLVNIDGERFINEEIMHNPAFAANAVARQTDGCAYMIFDEHTNLHYEQNDWDFLMSKLPFKRSKNINERIEKAQAEGFNHLWAVDSITEIAQVTGINLKTLTQTIETYNIACDSGQDNLFFKKNQFLRPISHPKFYVAQFYVGGYGSLGGIKINHRAEVLTEKGNIINGLYAIGRDANALYNGTYLYAMSGNDSAFDFNSGRIAAENAASMIKKDERCQMKDGRRKIEDERCQI